MSKRVRVGQLICTTCKVFYGLHQNHVAYSHQNWSIHWQCAEINPFSNCCAAHTKHKSWNSELDVHLRGNANFGKHNMILNEGEWTTEQSNKMEEGGGRRNESHLFLFCYWQNKLYFSRTRSMTGWLSHSPIGDGHNIWVQFSHEMSQRRTKIFIFWVEIFHRQRKPWTWLVGNWTAATLRSKRLHTRLHSKLEAPVKHCLVTFQAQLNEKTNGSYGDDDKWQNDIRNKTH